MNEAERAADAQLILASEVYKDAWKFAEQQIREQMLLVSPSDTTMQCRLVDQVKMLHQLHRYFETTLQTGQQARLRQDTLKHLRRV